MARVIIIADDLTGALDSAAPFAARGLSTIALTMPNGLRPDLPEDAAVITISTASRELSASEAQERVRAAAKGLDTSDTIVFKKIDSRLKGHAAAETGMLMNALGFRRSLVAPAIPDLGRRVEQGCVVGWGIDRPISIADAFASLTPRYHAPDADGDTALEAAAGSALDQKALLVGARGFATALANLVSVSPPKPTAFTGHAPFTFVIGSRDPITVGQIAYLRRMMPDFETIEAPDGDFASAWPSRATSDRILLVVPQTGREPPVLVARRFARGAVERLGAVRTLIVAGGESAEHLLSELDVSSFRVHNEIMPGIVWSSMETSSFGTLNLVTKSGGFGIPSTLHNLYLAMRAQ